MGNTTWDDSSRSVRATAMCYSTAPMSKTFTQQTKRCVHESMDSTKIAFREARDSEAHPNTVPIILALDVTGSMGSVPMQLVAEGLPTLMSNLIQHGCPDATLLFLAIGDHECDSYPVQAGQFESGDAELDMWLTRTYIEGGGGGNAGESYPLAWEFAANRVKTDAWDKRKQKGFLFTIGDEPFLKNFPASALNEIYGDNSLQQGTVSAAEFYAAACEKFNVYHISLEHGGRDYTDKCWPQLFGPNNLIVMKDHTLIPNKIAELVVAKAGKKKQSNKVAQTDVVTPADAETAIPVML